MLLSVENLRVSYDNIKALHGINFRIDEGEIVCIIGANGAGKSTTLRAISRLVPVEAGTKMTFMGRNMLKYPADKVVSELGISHVPEGRRLFDNLTVMENLRLAAFARRDGRAVGNDMDRVFSIFPRLKERQIQKAGTLSGGEQQMLAVGRAFVSGRKIMLLDEPSMGLAPLLMMSVFDSLKVGPPVCRSRVCTGKRKARAGGRVRRTSRKPPGQESLSRGLSVAQIRPVINTVCSPCV
jgi:branched-chain amino acid transport system ATP-binding protein